MTKAEKFQTVFTKGGINTRRILVLGDFVHVDTFNKYRDRLIDVMTAAGFAPVYEKDGVHMDRVDGYRIVFKAAA